MGLTAPPETWKRCHWNPAHLQQNSRYNIDKSKKNYKPTDLTVNGDFSTMIRSYSSRSYITCSLDLIFCWHSCQCHCTTTEVLDNMSLSLRDLHPGHRAVLEAGLDCKGWWFVDIPPSLKWMTLLLERMNLQVSVCCTPSWQIYLNLKMAIWQIDMFLNWVHVEVSFLFAGTNALGGQTRTEI